MSPEKSRSRPRHGSIESEEERVWIGFYRRAERDPSIATEILSQLEADPEMKRKHSALYLCCKDTLRQQKTRQARNKRIGQFVRKLIHDLFVAPWQELRRLLRNGSDIAVECLPEIEKEPAVAQVRRLPRKTGAASERAAFEQQGNLPGTTSPLAEVPFPATPKTSRPAS